MKDSLKETLKFILENKNVNHKSEILKQVCLKDAHAYCIANRIPGNIYGPLLENYIKNKYEMKRNSPSNCIGDLKHNEMNYEIKVSCGGKDHNKFNYVQLRLNHDCEYLLTAYYLTLKNVENIGELFIFKLSKDQIKDLILDYGGYAHGTVKKLGKITKKSLEDPENNKEYALRPKYGDKCWKALLKFSIDESLI